jgi:predicted nuclease of restriction endonuclease-like (RecB) superfamily
VTPQSPSIIFRLSFTHLAEIIALPDEFQRRFYEIECIRGNWSVRALKRQISSLYFERSGLSLDKDKLSTMAHAAADKAEPRLAIRDPYIFDFLGLKSSEVVLEADLESAMLANLQEFLLELGHGFCLEARQKSILIGQTRGFVDLVFYHRVLSKRLGTAP